MKQIERPTELKSKALENISFKFFGSVIAHIPTEHQTQIPDTILGFGTQIDQFVSRCNDTVMKYSDFKGCQA
jgi:hypothetical protein